MYICSLKNSLNYNNCMSTTPNKPRSDPAALEATYVEMTQPGQSNIKSNQHQQQQELPVLNDKEIKQETAKPVVSQRFINCKWVALFLILVLLVGTGIIIYSLARSNSPVITEKRTISFPLSTNSEMDQTHYDRNQNGQKTHFEVTSIVSDQNGQKKYSGVVQTPILLDSATVQMTQQGTYVYYIDPTKLWAQLKKMNGQTQGRRLQKQPAQTSAQTEQQTSQTSAQNDIEKAQWNTDSFWKGLIVPDSDNYTISHQEYVACEERPGQREGQFVYVPVEQIHQERLLMERQLLSYDIVPYVQLNGRIQAEQATYKLNAFGRQIENINRNKYKAQEEIMTEANQKLRRDLLNDAASCFYQDNKKYCPQQVWENPNTPFRVNPPFNFANKRYESRPIFTIEKTDTWGNVEGKADVAGYAQITKDFTSSGSQVQSGQGGKGQGGTSTNSENGNTRTSVSAEGQAAAAGNTQINGKNHFSQSQTVSVEGKAQAGAVTLKENGQTTTGVVTKNDARGTATSVITGNTQTSKVQVGSQEGGSSAGGATTQNRDGETTTRGATKGNGEVAAKAGINENSQTSQVQAGSQKGGSSAGGATTKNKDGETTTGIATNGSGSGSSKASIAERTQTSGVLVDSQKGGLSTGGATTQSKYGQTETGAATKNNASASTTAVITNQHSTSITQVFSGQGGSGKGGSQTKTNNSATSTNIKTNGPAFGFGNSQVSANGQSSYITVSSSSNGSASGNSSTSTKQQQTNTQINTSGNTGSSSANVASTTNISNNQGSPRIRV